MNKAVGPLAFLGMFKEDTGSSILAKKKTVKPIPVLVSISTQEYAQG